MFDKGFFGGMFDFDGDGKLDTLERAADFGFFCKLMDDAEKDSYDHDEFDEYDEYDDEDDF